MNIGVLIVLALVNLTAALLSLGSALAAAGDAGSSDNRIFWGLIGGMVGAGMFILFGTWALVLWLTPL